MNAIYAALDALLPFEFLQYFYMKNAFLALLLLSPLLALLGTMAVNRRMAFFSDALGHSALTGVGLGILLGLESQLIAMLFFGILWAILICRINRSGHASTDTIISVFSSTSVALGLVILTRGGRFAKYSSLLIGDATAVAPGDIGLLAAALFIGVSLWGLIYNGLLMSSVSPPLAQSRGVRTRLYEYAFVVLVAVAVMLAIRWVGTLLINALLILPAASARNISKSARQHAAFSVGIALFCAVSGLIVAYQFDASVGAAVVLCAAVCYGLTLGIGRFVRR